MNIDINNIVRSIAITAIGLPLALSVNNSLRVSTELAVADRELTPTQALRQEFGDKLAKPCLKYIVSDVDSKLEREAKTAIDEVLGGEAGGYASVCQYVLD